MAVLSIATGMGLALTDSRQARNAHFETARQLQEVERALEHFFNTYGRLPCPAGRSDTLGDATFGQEILGGNCDNIASTPSDTSRLHLGGSVYVRFGSLPTRSLMLRDDLMLDAFENRITYAVMEKMTDNTFYSDISTIGTLTVNDGNGSDITTSAAFVLISHGENGRGAYSRFGIANNKTCTGSTPDVENCDNDGTFSRAAFELEAGSATYFDDLLLWGAKY